MYLLNVLHVCERTWKSPFYMQISKSKLHSLPLFWEHLYDSCHSVQVNFLTKLVALKPGKTVLEMIRNVMQGKDEGADNFGSEGEDGAGQTTSSGIAGRVS